MEPVTGKMNSKTKSYKLPFEKLAFATVLLSLNLATLAAPAQKPKVPASKKQAPAKEAKLESKSEKTATVIKNEVQGCKSEQSLESLVARPEEWIGKEVCFKGTFSSFSVLALDYPPALRERKKYVSLTLFRPNTKIPLGELKLAMKIEDAQKHELLPKVAEGDFVKIKGKVFSAALGEPWIDISQIQVTKNPNNKEDSVANNGFDDI